MLENAGNAIKAMPKLYDDAIKPTAKETGKTMSLLPKTINAALVPLRRWIVEQEYSLAETEKLLEIKLKNIDQEKIVTPETYVAVPALQAISYSMDSEELRNMYANLLAKAMNIDEKEKVHPAFVELIKQITPREAVIFDRLYRTAIIPVMDLYIKTSTGNNAHIYNITTITDFSYNDVTIALDNLVRMGLIEIPFGEKYTEDSVYEMIRNTNAYSEERKLLEQMNIGEVKEEKKYIKKTFLGKAFFEVCLVD